MVLPNPRLMLFYKEVSKAKKYYIIYLGPGGQDFILLEDCPHKHEYS